MSQVLNIKPVLNLKVLATAVYRSRVLGLGADLVDGSARRDGGAPSGESGAGLVVVIVVITTERIRRYKDSRWITIPVPLGGD